MKGKIILMISLMLLTTVILQANEIEITQPTTLNLTGGDSQTLNLTVTYTGSNKATCTMSYSIPDGEGIDITYIPSTFTLNHNGAQKVTMIINTSLILMPNIYTITTQVSAVSSKGTSSSNSDITIITEPTKPVDVPLEEEPPEDTTDDIIIDDIIDDNLYTDNPDTTWQDYALPIIIILFAIVIITLLYMFRRRKKNEKNKKEH